MTSHTRAALRRRLGVLIPALFLSFPCAPSPAQVFPAPEIHKAEPFTGSAITNWDYDRDGDHATDFRKQDLDGDGVVDRYLKDRDANGSFDLIVPKAPREGRTQRHLIICVDSVPFSVMEGLWRTGHFRDFHPPGRVISSFPSDTNPAFAEIFGMAKSPGMEDRYYDRALNRIVGGKWDHMVRRDGRADGTFHAAFDYEEHPRYGALMYLAPSMVSDHDLARCRTVFWRLYREKPADQPIFLYIGSTDAISHREGLAGLVRQLLRVEGIIDEIVFHAGGDIRISLFSDHGNNLAYSGPMIDLGGHLARKGFRPAAALKGPRDVVVPRFGQVGDACIYTREENREAVAEALATLKGVGFSVYVKDAACVVEGPLGKAKITRDGGRYRYEMVSGDPLKLGEIIAGMRLDGKIDAEGYGDDAAWFAATRAHVYPDILRRLAAAVTDHVVNRPDVLVSLEEGYRYGGGFFAKMMALHGAHGSAAGTQTIGMAMSTDRAVPAFIRAADVMEALGEAKPGSRAAAQMSPTSTPSATPAAPATATPTPANTATPAPTSPPPSPTPTGTATGLPTATPSAKPTGTPAPTITPAARISPPSTPPASTHAPILTPAPPVKPGGNSNAPAPPADKAPGLAGPAPPAPSPGPARTRRPMIRALRRTPLPRRSPPPARTPLPGAGNQPAPR